MIPHDNSTRRDDSSYMYNWKAVGVRLIESNSQEEDQGMFCSLVYTHDNLEEKKRKKRSASESF